MARNLLRQKRNKLNGKTIKVSQTVVVKPPQRTSTGIDRWKSAMQQADRGRRANLVELYDNLLIDTVLSDSVGKRIRAITNSDIVFQKDGKEIEPIMDLIDTPAFEELLEECMKTKFYGKSIIELDFTNGFTVTSIDRRHLNTETKQILANQYDTHGISYEEPNDFILNLGKDNDLGLFLKTAPHAIFKRNGGADYAQFCELFGIPMLAGLYDPEDETGRQEMENAFANRGSGGSVVMSKNSEIKTIGEKQTGNVDIHDRFLKRCDEQILIGVIGQTMTTLDGSSYSQGKVHQDVEDEINKADRRFIQRILNQELLPRLAKRGYPVEGGWFSFPEKEKALTKKEQLEIAEKVHSLTEHGIDEKYWYENFGLPKGNRKKKERKEQPSKEVQEEEESETKETPKQKNKQTLSAKVNFGFWRRVVDFFQQAPR
ncbi:MULTISPECIES: phage portal protein family protein [unclassified Myroides]|uniref:phage portal protein family protein n=1 Tax=unclassified Myroides TaxID=2642485 RepID=UPI003D2F8F7A